MNITFSKSHRTYEEFEKGWFTSSICTYDGYSRITVDSEVDTSQDDFFLSVSEKTIFNFEEGWTEFFGCRENEDATRIFDYFLYVL